MKAKLKQRWDAVKPGDVYPTTFREGDVIEGELAELALDLKVAEPAGEIKSAAPTIRAKVKKGVEGFAEGVVVEGDEARELIAAGKAVLIKDKGAAPETK